MAYSFNGSTKVITLSSGTVTMGVRDLWSRWVDWWVTGDNSKYPIAFEQVGGNDIDVSAGTSIPIYAFLKNGWKVKPQEANHTLNVNDGILLVDGGGDPFVNTTGSYIVRINYSQPVQAITVSTGGGGGGGGATAAEIWGYGSRTLTESAGLSTEEHNHLMKLRNGGGGGAVIDGKSIEEFVRKGNAPLVKTIEKLPEEIKEKLDEKIAEENNLAEEKLSDIIESKDKELEKALGLVNTLSEKTESAITKMNETAVTIKQNNEKLLYSLEVKELEKEIEKETSLLDEKVEKQVQEEISSLDTSLDEKIQDETKELDAKFDKQIQDEIQSLESNLQ